MINVTFCCGSSFHSTIKKKSCLFSIIYFNKRLQSAIWVTVELHLLNDLAVIVFGNLHFPWMGGMILNLCFVAVFMT